MSYLLDTHILLWWLFDDPVLNAECREIISNSDNQILVSSASAWEIATKYRIGKLPEAESLVERYAEVLEKAEFTELPVNSVHAIRAGSLPIAHRDPFDRMIMAQAELEDIPVLTYDKAFNVEFIQTIPEMQPKR